MPAAIPYINAIVPKDQLVLANSTLDMIYEFGTILGMGISGFLVLALEAKGVLLLGGILFIIAGILNLMMRSNIVQSIDNKSRSIWGDFVDSLKYIKSSNTLTALFFIQMAIMVLLMTIPVILIDFTEKVLQVDTRFFSMYEAIYACGILLGNLFIPLLCKKLNNKYALVTLLAVMTIGLLACYLNSDKYAMFPIYLSIGVGIASWALALTLTQLACADQYLGRLQATFNGLSGIFVLIIYVLLGATAVNISPAFIYLIQGFIALFCIVLTMAFLKSGAIEPHLG